MTSLCAHCRLCTSTVQSCRQCKYHGKWHTAIIVCQPLFVIFITGFLYVKSLPNTNQLVSNSSI